MRLFRVFIFAVAISTVCPSCDKRGPVRTELELAQKELDAKKAELLSLQNESKALSASMGKYNTAGQGLIDQLTKETATLTAAIDVLKKEKQAAEQKNAEAAAETSNYLKSYAKP
jgi:predicted  nucleic acid-binding Zn-ribbon protein